MESIDAEFLCEVRVALHPVIDVGTCQKGHRYIFPVKGGDFFGPRLRGRVLPDSGADWAWLHADGSWDLDVRFCLETHDGAVIYAHWHGRFTAPAEHMEYALDQTKPDDPAGANRYYFRAAPEFECGHPDYSWLNDSICVALGRTGAGGVVYRFFRIA